MLRKLIWLAVLITLIAISIFVIKQYFWKTQTNLSENENIIRVETPRPNEKIVSPLFVKGEARGYWFFEASFPIKLVDENNNVLAIGIAQAKEDWMTENFVPFETKIEFSKPTAKKGFLILEKDNPSGLPENSKEIKIPINF